MIKYRLGCSQGHEFDSWFASGATFEDQAHRQLVVCPHCQSTAVDRLPMAPAVVSSRKKAAPRQEALTAVTAPAASDIIDHLRQLKRKLIDQSEYVGSGFADEARKIHYGESQERAIYGEATPEEARSLSEDEIPFSVLPPLPEDHN